MLTTSIAEIMLSFYWISWLVNWSTILGKYPPKMKTSSHMWQKNQLYLPAITAISQEILSHLNCFPRKLEKKKRPVCCQANTLGIVNSFILFRECAWAACVLLQMDCQANMMARKSVRKARKSVRKARKRDRKARKSVRKARKSVRKARKRVRKAW